MKLIVNSIRQEMRFARQAWSDLRASRLRDLRSLLLRCKFSIILGEITWLDSRWYVTHSGLLQLASRRNYGGISTSLQERLSDPAANRWVFRAVVYKGPNSRGFVGYGDADPSNTSPLVRGAEMRVAETRAVNRALRKAYGIGLCSVEYLGSQPVSIPPSHEGKPDGHSNGNAFSNGQPRLRDKLCLLIRKYELDPNLVKRYAADFRGDEKALLGLTGILRTTRKSFAGRAFLNLKAFAPSTEWEFISKDARERVVAGGSNDIQLHAD